MSGQKETVVGTTAKEELNHRRNKGTKLIAPNISPEAFTGEFEKPFGTLILQPSKNEILQKARILISSTYEVAPKAISIFNDGEYSTFGTLGNFSLVKGKAKSKKTFLMCLVLAACIGTEILQGKIKCELPSGKRRVLVFDTEQSKYHVWKRLQAISALSSGLPMENIEIYSLREFSPIDRCELINYAIMEGNPDNNIGLVVIDGIRDLIDDINDPKEGTKIATKLLQWTTLAWCHIITVLHENKGDSNPRGHIGTELLNKAETVIAVTVTKEDKAVSIVEAEMTRDKDFPSFAFRILDNGQPEIICDYEMTRTGEKQKGFDPYSIQPDIHHQILSKVFKDQKEFNRPDLQKAVGAAWGAYSQKVGSNKAGEYIAYCAQMGWIKNEGQPGRPGRWIYLT